MSQSAWPSRSGLGFLQSEMMFSMAWPLLVYFKGAMLGVAYSSMMMRLLRAESFPAPVQPFVQPALQTGEFAVGGLEAITTAFIGPALEAVAKAIGGPLGEALTNQEILQLPVGAAVGPFSATVLEAAMLSERDAGEARPSTTAEA